MTTADFFILCACIAPSAFIAGLWFGLNRAQSQKCCACGKQCTGIKCDDCAEF